LPIKTQYNEVTKLLLPNPHVITIETTLDLRPYYLFEYRADVGRIILTLGWLSCYSGHIDIPNMDKLTANGLWYSNWHIEFPFITTYCVAKERKSRSLHTNPFKSPAARSINKQTIF
jgi:hypothetical protein